MNVRIEKIINKFLNISRSECKKVLKDGRVLVNNKTILKPITINTYKDLITIDGFEIDYKEYQYYILNKPSGYVCANYDRVNETIFDIIDLNPNEYFSYGRLDKDTEGLLIISNDGKMGHRIINSKYEIPKRYYFEIDKEIDEKIKTHHPKPILISNKYLVKKYDFEFISSKTGYITIYEGKFHQVKEMFNFFGYNVLFLKRVSIGKLILDNNHKIGELKEISFEDLEKIF